jgi:hypothetical protein
VKKKIELQVKLRLLNQLTNMKKLAFILSVFLFFAHNSFAKNYSTHKQNNSTSISIGKCGAWHEMTGAGGSVIGRWRDCGSYYQIQNRHKK